MKNKFYFEVTDTFGGEMNYCWLHRYIINATTERGAISKLARHTGLKFKFNGIHYKAQKACIASYVLDFEIQPEWIEKATEL